jgi:PleD family two-component response regulator
MDVPDVASESRRKRSVRTTEIRSNIMVSSSDVLHARILAVDDKEANVCLVERMLPEAGYSAMQFLL